MSTRSTRTQRASRRAPDAGLSLLEMMVVLTIIGLVSAFAAPQVIGYLERSKVDAASIQIKNLNAVLDMYRLDVGRFPTEDEGLEALLERPDGVDAWRGPYLALRESLVDPWGRAYAYSRSEDGARPAVVSYGADGVEGGEGPAADVMR